MQWSSDRVSSNPLLITSHQYSLTSRFSHAVVKKSNCQRLHCCLLQNIGWFRTGSEVYYGPNSIKKGKQLYYTLTFTVEFPHDNDWVHLAHCYPYTYTDLQQHLSVICKVVNSVCNIGMMGCRSCQCLLLHHSSVYFTGLTDDWPLSPRRKNRKPCCNLHCKLACICHKFLCSPRMV